MVSGNDVRKETRAALSQVVICHSVRNRQRKAVSAVLYNKIDRTLNKFKSHGLSIISADTFKQTEMSFWFVAHVLIHAFRSTIRHARTKYDLF